MPRPNQPPNRFTYVRASVLIVLVLVSSSSAFAEQPAQSKKVSTRGNANSIDHTPEVWMCAHNSITTLIDPATDWSFVRERLTGIKLYIGQLRSNQRRDKGASAEQLRQFAKLVRENNLQIAVELGGCLEFSPLDSQAGEWSARSELAAIDKYYAAGGKVDFLDIDGPIRRLLHPKNRRDGKRFESIEDAADELVDALKIHHEAHPETRYWLLTNFPNWGWRGNVSYHARGPARQDYGDYDTVVRIVLKKLRDAGIQLDGVTVDNPYEYLVGERRSATIADPTTVNWLKRVRDYEDFARQQGLKFNLIINSEQGGKESDAAFFRETLKMVDAYRKAGGRPTRWIVQSWYDYPKMLVPETAPDSLTALVAEVIRQVRIELEFKDEQKVNPPRPHRAVRNAAKPFGREEIVTRLSKLVDEALQSPGEPSLNEKAE